MPLLCSVFDVAGPEVTLSEVEELEGTSVVCVVVGADISSVGYLSLIEIFLFEGGTVVTAMTGDGAGGATTLKLTPRFVAVARMWRVMWRSTYHAQFRKASSQLIVHVFTKALAATEQRAQERLQCPIVDLICICFGKTGMLGLNTLIFNRKLYRYASLS